MLPEDFPIIDGVQVLNIQRDSETIGILVLFVIVFLISIWFFLHVADEDKSLVSIVISIIVLLGSLTLFGLHLREYAKLVYTIEIRDEEAFIGVAKEYRIMERLDEDTYTVKIKQGGVPSLDFQ